jgi:hypothetical protein
VGTFKKIELQKRTTGYAPGGDTKSTMGGNHATLTWSRGWLELIAHAQKSPSLLESGWLAAQESSLLTN